MCLQFHFIAVDAVSDGRRVRRRYVNLGERHVLQGGGHHVCRIILHVHVQVLHGHVNLQAKRSSARRVRADDGFGVPESVAVPIVMRGHMPVRHAARQPDAVVDHVHATFGRGGLGVFRVDVHGEHMHVPGGDLFRDAVLYTGQKVFQNQPGPGTAGRGNGHAHRTYCDGRLHRLIRYPGDVRRRFLRVAVPRILGGQRRGNIKDPAPADPGRRLRAD